MRCLVTGVAGFIGSHLAEALIAEGHSVEGVDCFTDSYLPSAKSKNVAGLIKDKNFRLLKVDLSRQNLAGIREPDFVFHLAAQPGVRSSWGASFSGYIRDNVLATQRLLEVARSWNVDRFIYSSSSSVYGDSESLPTPEESPQKPISPYGVTKLAAEHLCGAYRRNFSIPTVILRYFTVYGPRQRPDMAFSILIDAIDRGKPIKLFGGGKQERDFTYVEDAVRGTVMSMRAAAGTTYNIGTGVSVPLADVVSDLETILGKKAMLTLGDSAAGDVKRTCADVSKIERDLGFRAQTGIVEGLRRQVGSTRNRGSRGPKSHVATQE